MVSRVGLLAALFLGLSLSAPADVLWGSYTVTVTAIRVNLYEDAFSKILIETQLCSEPVVMDTAFLKWAGRCCSWIRFSNKHRCPVVALR